MNLDKTDYDGCFNIHYCVQGNHGQTKSWVELLSDVTKQLTFNTAIKFDRAWTNLTEPYTNWEEDEFWDHFHHHGCVISKQPFIWRAYKPAPLMAFVPSLFGADESLIAALNRDIDWSHVRELDSLEAFWVLVNQSAYVLTTWMDYCGFIFLTRNESIFKRQLLDTKTISDYRRVFVGNTPWQ